ncbi:CLUMA_CG014303, isoform A, partial [Clunio marinus]
MFLKQFVLLLFCALITKISSRPHYMLSPYAHRAVLENDALEETFPDHFRNPFMKTPRVRVALSRFSRLHHGETPVKNRIADAVPRKEIYKLLTHAGLVKRNDFPYA